MDTNTFLQQLHTEVRNLQATVETELAPLDDFILNFKPSPERWSVLECLEHLNRYSRYYNLAIANAVQKVPARVKQEPLRYSWLGRKSIGMMEPSNNKQYKTVKHMNPTGSDLGRNVLTEFQAHQTQLLQLLTSAQKTDLNKKAVPVEFFRLLKLGIGEALEFVVRHEERHVQQAIRAKQQAASARLTLVV
ncbi:DinB family protein [Hymenobacter sp. GOD-10R]|uniref:DinB family protein n=1 Tax=Hymenobacter sp. GOD-10R TaxID=3093922 RepID=UPI002D794A8F|nr:DinB family protein [Hymenobacter sp. GOD-10R]WRQ28335.1 DinB family protein [Hymenobacter sp. GOD-10R]